MNNPITRQTRAEAHANVLPKSMINRQRILTLLQCHFKSGATAYELSEALSWPITSVRPRLSELLDSGKLCVTGKRLNAKYTTARCAIYAIAPIKPAATQSAVRTDIGASQNCEAGI